MANARYGLKGLFIAFVLSFTLHLLVFWLALNNTNLPTANSPQLTINIQSNVAKEAINRPVITRNRRTLPELAEKNIGEKIQKEDRQVPGKDEPAYHFDVSQLLSQAREVARSEYKNTNASHTLYGEYAGVFTGKYSGIFFLRFAPNGQVSGSGQTDSGDILFSIKGVVEPNGKFHASAFNHKGSGGLFGYIDTKTGVVNGTWSAHIWKGQFSGKHE